MNLGLGKRLAHGGEKAQVLDDEGIGTGGKRAPGRLNGARELGLLHHDVHRHVDPHTTAMRQAAQLGKLPRHDAARAATRIELARNAAVDGVCPRRDGGEERLAVSGGSQQLWYVSLLGHGSRV